MSIIMDCRSTRVEDFNIDRQTDADLIAHGMRLEGGEGMRSSDLECGRLLSVQASPQRLPACDCGANL